MDLSTSSEKFKTCHAQKISMPSSEKSDREPQSNPDESDSLSWVENIVNESCPWDLNHEILRLENFRVGTISVKVAQKISAGKITYVWLLMGICISGKSITISLALLLSEVRSFFC
jgi:hypothetical protein